MRYSDPHSRRWGKEGGCSAGVISLRACYTTAGGSLDGGQVLGDDSRFGFLRLTAPSSLAPFADNSSRRRRRGRRWRRGLIDDRLRWRWGGLLTPRQERRGNHDGNYRRTTQQPVAGHFLGNVDHPFLHG